MYSLYRVLVFFCVWFLFSRVCLLCFLLLLPAVWWIKVNILDLHNISAMGSRVLEWTRPLPAITNERMKYDNRPHMSSSKQAAKTYMFLWLPAPALTIDRYVHVQWEIAVVQSRRQTIPHRKAETTLAIMSKQHCRMLQVEWFFRQSRMLLRHRCHYWQRCRTKFRPFDKVKTNWTCLISFDFVELTKFRSTLLPKTAIMSKQHSTLSKKQYFTINSFDIVAVFWQQRP